METTRIDTNIWGPLVQDEQLVVQVYVQWFKGLFIFYDSQVFNCLSDTWFQALDHIKLHLPLAYHGMEVINNKVFTIGGYSDKAPEVRKRFD